jgi:hypothetical protein
MEAAIDHCVRRFWSALPCSTDDATALPVEAEQALLGVSADVAVAVCQGHPNVADSKLGFTWQLNSLPTALHTAVCSAAARAVGGTLSIVCGGDGGNEDIDGEEQILQLLPVAAALPSAERVRAIEVHVANRTALRGALLAALEGLLTAVRARRGLPCAPTVAKAALFCADPFQPASFTGTSWLPRVRRCLQLMGSCRLQELNASGTCPEVPGAVVAALQALPALTRLDLHGTQPTDKHLVALAAALSSLRQLRDLSVDARHAGARGMHALAGSFAAMPGLRALCACWRAARAEARGAELAAALWPQLGALAGLTSLHLTGSDVSGNGAALGSQLRLLSALQRLSFDMCSLQPKDAGPLVSGLACLSRLTHLRVEHACMPERKRPGEEALL